MGTVSGSPDASFSNDNQFEMWLPNFMDWLEYGMGGDGRNGPNFGYNVIEVIGLLVLALHVPNG